MRHPFWQGNLHGLRRAFSLSVLLGLLAGLLSCGGKGGSAVTAGALLSAPEQSAPITAPPPTLDELEAALSAEFERLGIDPDKVAAAVTSSEQSAPFDLAAEAADPDAVPPPESPGVTLSWTELVPGDYDMNGEVSISDLTPLGANFRAIVNYDDPLQHNGLTWVPAGDPEDDGGVAAGEPPASESGAENWRWARIDGDFNSELNISDITPIAVHWHERLDGYHVYQRGPGEEEFVQLPDPTAASQPLLISREMAFPDGEDEPDMNRPVRYSYFVEIESEGTYEFYIVAADENAGEEGELSNIAIANVFITPNQTPEAQLVADPLTGIVPLEVSFDASTSNDLDGTIVLYEWDWDGDLSFDASGPSATIEHIYVNEGTYEAQVRVTDDRNGTDTASVTIEITNDEPTAVLSADPLIGLLPLEVNFDASASSDPDGYIALYEWDWESDGTYDSEGSEATAVHTYSQEGTYQATVRVNDNRGATATDTATIEVVTNFPPVALLEVTPTGGEPPLDISLDASGSTDINGFITKYEWDFDGDGTYDDEGTESTANHTFTTSGDYTPVVRVTDDQDATGTAAGPTVVVNLPPTAAFTADPVFGGDPLLVGFDATSSSDPDGTVAWYYWDWNNDGIYDADKDEPHINHMFMDPGLHDVMLMVKDDDGAQDIAGPLQIEVQYSPRVEVVAVPDEGDAPLAVDLDASGSDDPDGTITRFEWDWDSNGEYDLDTGTDPYAQHTYAEPGIHLTTVRATDNLGATGTGSVEIKCYVFPEADLSADPTEGNAPLYVSFDASGSFDEDGTIVKFEWDWEGDGEYDDDTGVGPLNDHTYMEASFYSPTVRVTDDDGWQDTASVDITVHGWAIIDVDTPGNRGKWNQMMIVDGRPAICYWSWVQPSGLRYIRAQDEIGLDWGDPFITPVDIDEDYNAGSWASMAIVDGYPAISYWVSPLSGGVYPIRYVRATDAQGSVWGTPVEILADSKVEGGHTSLAVVAGNPAIAYYDHGDSTNGLYYIRASDTTGATWPGSANKLDSGYTVGWYSSLNVVDGNPAIAYHDQNGKRLYYIRANDSTGASWGSPQTLASSGSNMPGRMNTLLVVDGNPAVSFNIMSHPYSASYSALCYVRANDTSGSSWPSPTILEESTDTAGKGRWPGIAFIDGNPAIACTDISGSQQLKLFEAQDAQGNSWAAPEVVTSGAGDEAGYVNVIVINGYIAISYYETVDAANDLQYAILL